MDTKTTNLIGRRFRFAFALLVLAAAGGCATYSTTYYPAGDGVYYGEYAGYEPVYDVQVHAGAGDWYYPYWSLDHFYFGGFHSPRHHYYPPLYSWYPDPWYPTRHRSYVSIGIGLGYGYGHGGFYSPFHPYFSGFGPYSPFYHPYSYGGHFYWSNVFYGGHRHGYRNDRRGRIDSRTRALRYAGTGGSSRQDLLAGQRRNRAGDADWPGHSRISPVNSSRSRATLLSGGARGDVDPRARAAVREVRELRSSGYRINTPDGRTPRVIVNDSASRGSSNRRDLLRRNGNDAAPVSSRRMMESSRDTSRRAPPVRRSEPVTRRAIQNRSQERTLREIRESRSAAPPRRDALRRASSPRIDRGRAPSSRHPRATAPSRESIKARGANPPRASRSGSRSNRAAPSSRSRGPVSRASKRASRPSSSRGNRSRVKSGGGRGGRLRDKR